LTTATARIEGAKIFLGFVFSLLLSTRVLRTKNVAENRKKNFVTARCGSIAVGSR